MQLFRCTAHLGANLKTLIEEGNIQVKTWKDKNTPWSRTALNVGKAKWNMAVCPIFLSLEVEWAPPVLSLAQGSRWSTIKGVWSYGWMPGFLSPWIFRSTATMPLVIYSECFHTPRILGPAPRWGPAVPQPDLRCRWILLEEIDISSLEGSRKRAAGRK